MFMELHATAKDKIRLMITLQNLQYALSFYCAKMILDRPKFFGWVNLFWTGTNHFGQAQITFFWTSFYNLDLSKMIWTCPKQIGLVQNCFGPIEGQGIGLKNATIS